MKPALSIPKIRLLFDGRDLAVSDMHCLESLVVRQRLSQPTLCSLTFRDLSDAALNGLAIPGKKLSVEIEGFPGSLFAGEVTAVEYDYEPDRGQLFRVRSYDLLHRLRKRQPVRSHLNISLTDLVREMVQEFGFSVEASDSGPVFRRVIQYQQSDLDLLVDLAQRAGLYLTLSGDTLHLVTLEGYGGATALELGRTLLEARVEFNVETACRQVNVDGWDPSVVEWKRGSAATARSGRSIQAGLQPSDTGGSGEITFAGLVAEHSNVLDSQAQSELDRRVAGEATLWGIAQGTSELRPGRLIEVEGLAKAFCGTYVATEVSHMISRDSGFVSEFSTAPPPPLHHIQPSVPVVGVVTRIDDPEGLGRVRAKLPSVGDLETEWMCVVTPGGGPLKGLIALPDVGDQVCIATSPMDPSMGIVLGSIPGSKGLPDTGIERGEVVRYSFQTPGGQRIRLDDRNRRVRVENSSGSFVEIAPEGVKLHCNTDLTVEAPGRNIVIQGKRIDFRRI